MEKFWQTKNLVQMSDSEWEQLCDGCGKCCLQKLECEDSGEIFYTDVACKLLDLETCRCSNYDNRFTLVPMCLKLDKNNMSEWSYLPATCAYRLLHEGKTLPDWHPLIDQSASLMNERNISIAGRVLPETVVDEVDLEDHIIHWVN